METETYSTWETIWKLLFISTLVVFAAMSVWVTIGGYKDLKKLFSQLENENQDD